MKRVLFAEQHPVWFVFILEVVIIFVYLLSGTVATIMRLSNTALYGMANFGLAIIAVFLITIMGWWRKIGFRPLFARRDWVYYLVPFIPMLINLIPGIQVINLKHLLVILSVTLAVGFVEEAYFRGLMLTALKTTNAWMAILVTSLLFGLTHALNLLAGKSPLEAAAQVLYALAIGVAFSALVVKKGVLWPLVIAHFLIDFTNLLQVKNNLFSPQAQVIIVFTITVLFAAYGVWIMRQPTGLKYDFKETVAFK